MEMILLAALLTLAPDAPLEDLQSFADACVRHDNCSELAAIAWTESGFHRIKKRSGKGACCYMGILGSRYDNPSCDALEADPYLCVDLGAKKVAGWKKSCGKSGLDGYNGGWQGCWSRPPKNADDKRCKGQCDSYTRKVRRFQKKIETAMASLEEWQRRKGDDHE